MGFLKATQLEDYKEETIKEEILTLAKELVELRLKKATRQNFKPHNFKHKKRKLSQLLTLQNSKNLTVK
jgi:large subunit ribosomal protein L29